MVADRHIELLGRVLHQIRMTTLAVDEGVALPEALLTSAELARLFGTDHERTKKQLKQLRQLGLIRAMDVNPKRYRFDAYGYNEFMQADWDDATALALKAWLAEMETQQQQFSAGANAMTNPSLW